MKTCAAVQHSCQATASALGTGCTSLTVILFLKRAGETGIQRCPCSSCSWRATQEEAYKWVAGASPAAQSGSSPAPAPTLWWCRRLPHRSSCPPPSDTPPSSQPLIHLCTTSAHPIYKLCSLASILASGGVPSLQPTSRGRVHTTQVPRCCLLMLGLANPTRGLHLSVDEAGVGSWRAPP